MRTTFHLDTITYITCNMHLSESVCTLSTRLHNGYQLLLKSTTLLDHIILPRTSHTTHNSIGGKTINIITKAPNFSYLHFHIWGTWVEYTNHFKTSIE